jgi:hypothetical protein
MIKTVEAWHDYVSENWERLNNKANEVGLPSVYHQLLFMALYPVLPRNKATFKQFIDLLGSMRHTRALIEYVEDIYHSGKYDIPTQQLVMEYLDIEKMNLDERAGLDWVVMMTGVIRGYTLREDGLQSVNDLLSTIGKHENMSALRVQAGMISAGKNVVIAGRDAQIITNVYQGDQAQLLGYLSTLRTDWDMPASSILPDFNTSMSAPLHRLYTPIDVWIDEPEKENHDDNHVVNTRWYRSIYHELRDERMPALEALALHPYLVVTGGAGSGKSSLGQYLVTSLAYACDAEAEKHDKVKGLDLLGAAWLHGELLPMYVSLQDLSHSKHFPKTRAQAGSKNLLAYIKENVKSFASHLEKYLTDSQAGEYNTVLVLDGLDEVGTENERVIIRDMIEKWTLSFPRCRVVVTCRTYAYNKAEPWRLSDKFASVELAPYTRNQMLEYIDRWYQLVVELRPSTLGGRNRAQVKADELIRNLKYNIDTNRTLQPLARHPLMMALLTLIHEEHQKLPNKRAELYEQTVELLDRWNLRSKSNKLEEKLSNLDYVRMRAALKMIAFDLQVRRADTHYPTTIKRGHLLEKLTEQQEISTGLGANIEDVLEYLATRNGILVTDTRKHYRFPHLSVQEYLCACALAEFYDECPMPSALKTPEEGWSFPKNIVALLRHDTTRWREVTLFAGSILASEKTGQDKRWELIDELLPAELGNKELPYNMLASISVAAAVWAEDYIKARNHSHRRVREHLIACLKAIRNDQRLDIPDNAKNLEALSELEKQDEVKA